MVTDFTPGGSASTRCPALCVRAVVLERRVLLDIGVGRGQPDGPAFAEGERVRRHEMPSVSISPAFTM